MNLYYPPELKFLLEQ